MPIARSPKERVSFGCQERDVLGSEQVVKEGVQMMLNVGQEGQQLCWKAGPMGRYVSRGCQFPSCSPSMLGPRDPEKHSQEFSQQRWPLKGGEQQGHPREHKAMDKWVPEFRARQYRFMASTLMNQTQHPNITCKPHRMF